MYEASCKDIQTYARITGYMAPVRSNWNSGKREEFKDRKMYDINKPMEKGVSHFVTNKAYHPTGDMSEYDTVTKEITQNETTSGI